MPETALNLTNGAVPQAAPPTTTEAPKTTKAPVPPPTGTEIGDKDGKAAEKALRKLLKADGQEFEVDEEQYQRFAQKGLAAEKRFAEVAKLRKEMEAKAQEIHAQKAEIEKLKQTYGDNEGVIDYLIEQAQNDPKKLSKVREKMEAWLLEQIKLESASPEQQALAQEKAERARLQKELEEIKKTQESEKMKALTQQHRSQIETTIIKALQVSGLPQNELNVKHMADLMHKAYVGGYEVTPEQLASFVKEDRVANIKAIAADYAAQMAAARDAKDSQTILSLGSSLEEIFSPELIQALRIYDLTRITNSQPKVPKPVIETQKPQAEDGKRHYMDWDAAKEEQKRIVQQLEQEWRRR